MAVVRSSPKHSTDSTNVADLLERVLDKGVVIAGDVKVSLLDIELLTIQIRLVICSIDKAKEMGMDWWANSPVFGNPAKPADDTLERLEQRLASIESSLPSPNSQAVQTNAPSTPDTTRRFKPVNEQQPDAS
ncbi:MAG: gas vesicle protein [Planctomycetota bacterium]